MLCLYLCSHLLLRLSTSAILRRIQRGLAVGLLLARPCRRLSDHLARLLRDVCLLGFSVVDLGDPRLLRELAAAMSLMDALVEVAWVAPQVVLHPHESFLEGSLSKHLLLLLLDVEPLEG